MHAILRVAIVVSVFSLLPACLGYSIFLSSSAVTDARVESPYGTFVRPGFPFAVEVNLLGGETNHLALALVLHDSETPIFAPDEPTSHYTFVYDAGFAEIGPSQGNEHILVENCTYRTLSERQAKVVFWLRLDEMAREGVWAINISLSDSKPVGFFFWVGHFGELLYQGESISLSGTPGQDVVREFSIGYRANGESILEASLHMPLISVWIDDDPRLAESKETGTIEPVLVGSTSSEILTVERGQGLISLDLFGDLPCPSREISVNGTLHLTLRPKGEYEDQSPPIVRSLRITNPAGGPIWARDREVVMHCQATDDTQVSTVIFEILNGSSGEWLSLVGRLENGEYVAALAGVFYPQETIDFRVTVTDISGNEAREEGTVEVYQPNHMLGILPGSSDQPCLINDEHQTPESAVEWARELKASFVVLTIGQHDWINIDMTPVWGVAPVGGGGSRRCLEDFAEVFEENHIYFATMFHTGFGALTYYYHFTADEVKTRLRQLANRMSELWSDNPYWLGVVWDFEYSGFSSANEKWPGVWSDASDFCRWLFDKSVSDGFMSTIWTRRPDALFFTYPDPVYCDSNMLGRYYDLRVGHFENHENYGYNNAGYWDIIGHAERTLFVHGVSADQKDLGWHVGNNGTSDWHTVGYRSGFKKVSSRPLDGLPQHFLETLLYNPWIHTVTWFSGASLPYPCPYCGATEYGLSREEKAFLQRVGKKLSQIPWTGPNTRFAMGGDLDWPGDGVGRYDRSAPFPILGSDSNPYVVVKSVPGMRWSLTATLQLWLINPCLEPVTTTVTWVGHDAISVTVAPMDFEVLQAPKDVPTPWFPGYKEPTDWTIAAYSPE